MDFIIVGLGNPGKEYELTRHNVGYLVIDILCNRYGGSLKKETPNSMADTIRIGDKKVLIAKPTTYMNDSGKGVGEIIRRYKSEPKQLIVIQDELDLELGDVKIKVGGGLAGHNGLKSIKDHIQSSDFIRIRIGIGKPTHSSRGASHVLKAFSKKETEEFKISCEHAADAIELIINTDIANAMNQIH
ncbi:MAG: aminoacyl-tRNA hydrolase [Acidimicrobiia bacterium]